MHKKIFLIGEIGINHNGDLKIAEDLINVAHLAGLDAVKFQKRTIDKVYTKKYLAEKRLSPWGTTQREQKEGLELDLKDYQKIDALCKEKGLLWSASAWDVDSQLFLRQFNLKFNKVASAMLGNIELLKTIAEEKKLTYISTGMSVFQEIDIVVDIFKKYDCPFELMHCNSTYPMEIQDANLSLINIMKERYQVPIGFSCHERGYIATLGAVALGASSIERHITLDQNMYGSDQKASIEPAELIKLVQDIRKMEQAMGTGEKIITKEEKIIRQKLRGD